MSKLGHIVWCTVAYKARYRTKRYKKSFLFFYFFANLTSPRKQGFWELLYIDPPMEDFLEGSTANTGKLSGSEVRK
jgi:hypothetical protein